MTDELNLELDNIENDVEGKLKVKNRFEKLSETAILATKAKDESDAKAKTEAERASNAEKERDFYKDFSANVSKYPNAGEYQEQILEKVKAGYSTEDAMVSVLAKEGKLTAPAQARPQNIEGGSAPTVIEGNKPISDMSASEKLEALKGINPHELSEALRGRF